MKSFFLPVAKASDGVTTGTPDWVKVEQEKTETLAKALKPPAAAFNAQYGSDLAALKDPKPGIGYVNKFVGAICTSKGDIPYVIPRPDSKRFLALTKAGDISGSARVPGLAVCLEDGCFQMAMNIEALCAAPPGALIHSPSQMPLSCPVAPQATRN